MNKLKQIFRQQIADELLRVRKEKGLSLSDVALQTDLSLSSIQNIENNSGKQKFKKYLHLIRFYGKQLKISLE